MAADVTAPLQMLSCEDREDASERKLETSVRACFGTIAPESVGYGAEDGVKRAEVITTRLLQDERGWLRLAG
jgi:hypothetical protein